MAYSNGYTPKSPQAKAFGKALQSARGARYTQASLGKKLGVSQPTVAAWENGVTVPEPDEIFNLEEILRVDSGELSRFFGFIPLPRSIRP